MATIPYLVSDMISRIRVGYITKMSFVKVLNSVFCCKILNILLREGYILSYEQSGYNCLVFLKYSDGNSAIKSITILSTPRRMQRVTFLELQQKSIQPFLILSTSYGLLTKDEAIKKRAGGLLLLSITC
jgi:ribosomal protein S8